MGSRQDLVGRVFSRLTVVSLAVRGAGSRRFWNCVCDCGATAVVPTTNLNSGNSKSCGCLHRGRLGLLARTHGMSGRSGSKYVHRLYTIWKSMRGRCNNPADANYANYGGRGINICAEWDSYPVFHAWAHSNGHSDELQIDRTDNSKGYSPENCRWVTRKVNGRNTRKNRVFDVVGETLCVAALAEKYGHPVGRVLGRLNIGWTIEEALFTPLNSPKGIRKEKP